jgi:hypothetical protein
VHLNGLLEFIDINRDGFRKALKKHDKVLGGLPHHARLQPEYLPKVDEKFADKNRPHLQARALRRMWPCRPLPGGLPEQGACGVLAEPVAPVACSATPKPPAHAAAARGSCAWQAPARLCCARSACRVAARGVSGGRARDLRRARGRRRR